MKFYTITRGIDLFGTIDPQTRITSNSYFVKFPSTVISAAASISAINMNTNTPNALGIFNYGVTLSSGSQASDPGNSHRDVYYYCWLQLMEKLNTGFSPITNPTLYINIMAICE